MLDMVSAWHEAGYVGQRSCLMLRAHAHGPQDPEPTENCIGRRGQQARDPEQERRARIKQHQAGESDHHADKQNDQHQRGGRTGKVTPRHHEGRKRDRQSDPERARQGDLEQAACK